MAYYKERSIIEVENISFGYGKKITIENLNLLIEKGNLTCIVGPNGCGKTTLIKLISGILKPFSGVIRINGKEISDYSNLELSKILSYLPQRVEFNPEITVIEAIFTARLLNFAFEPGRIDKEKVKDVIEEFNIYHLKDRKLSSLSGGELQKVLIAMLRARESYIYLFDEPLNNLDIKNQITIMEIIKTLVNEKRVVVCVLHDINMALKYADDIIFMREGKIKAFLKPQDVSRDILRDVFEVDMNVEIFGDKKIVFI